MNEYELIFIVHPDSDETAFGEIITRVGGWITESGGEIVKTDVWGKRKLAYPIRKQHDGLYVFMNVKMAPSAGAGLERNLRFTEAVMRYLLIAK